MLYEEKSNQIANLSKADKAAGNGVKKSLFINDNFTENGTENKNNTEMTNDLGIIVSNITAKWTDSQTNNSLENINLTVRPGRLVAIIGPVGSGKVNEYSLYIYMYRNCVYVKIKRFDCRVHYYKQFYENYHFLVEVLMYVV